MDIDNRLHRPHFFFTGSNIPSNASYNSHCIWLWVFSTLCFACLCLFVVCVQLCFILWKLEKQYHHIITMIHEHLICRRFYSFIWLKIYHINLCADEDEEGDRITVRGDEELQAMINGVGFKITSTSISVIIIVIFIIRHTCSCVLYKVGDLKFIIHDVTTWWYYWHAKIGYRVYILIWYRSTLNSG